MAKYIITAKQTNYMEIEVEADSLQEAEDIYNDTGDDGLIEHDFTRVTSEWLLLKIEQAEKEVEYYND